MKRFPFEASLAAAKSFEDLGTLIRAELAPLGFERFCFIAQFMEQFSTPPLVGCTSLSPEWISHYMQNAYAGIDPIVTLSTKTMKPFFWSTDDDWSEHGAAQAGFMADLASWGYRRGVCFPYGTAVHVRGFLNVCYESDENLESRLAKASLLLPFLPPEAMRLYLHNGRQSSLSMKLTQKEREIFLLVADGLTSQEIADRLLLSKRTVDGHIVAVQGKLLAENRQQALARAIILGLLRPTHDYRPGGDITFHFPREEQ